MYNLYNLEPKQSFLINYRKTNRLYKAMEIGIVLIIFASSFFWLFI